MVITAQADTCSSGAMHIHCVLAMCNVWPELAELIGECLALCLLAMTFETTCQHGHACGPAPLLVVSLPRIKGRTPLAQLRGVCGKSGSNARLCLRNDIHAMIMSGLLAAVHTSVQGALEPWQPPPKPATRHACIAADKCSAPHALHTI
jgi:hypothetical protein